MFFKFFISKIDFYEIFTYLSSNGVVILHPEIVYTVGIITKKGRAIPNP